MLALPVALMFFAVGGVGALAVGDRWCRHFGVGGVLAGCLCGLAPCLRVVLGGPAQSLRMQWDVPYGTLFLRLDALSAFFLIPVLLLCALAALYGGAYLEQYRAVKPLAPAWFFFNLLAASMVVVIVAHNGVLFLMAWEMMALASFFLVTFEDEKESVREAGWTYLVANHFGTAFLLALFILLGAKGGSLDFDRFTTTPQAGLLFLLAVIGFGTKAGFVPFHVWLPEAHPAAPSHVSAVMSAVMIKTGIYGLVRTMTMLGPPPLWWGWLLCGIGLSSGVLGVLFALAQHDLKRLLAYHSVENIGIIALGLGVGTIGMSTGRLAIAVTGLAGALLHVLNHALFKGLLFLAGGNVTHRTHTREIDRLGGLFKRMPVTGFTFLVGAAAICGLPPLNGFVSEFLIYLASLRAVLSLGGLNAAIPLAVIAGLALIGGLAIACFTKAFGISFLGRARSEAAARAKEVEPALLFPGLILALGCVVAGLFGASLVDAMGPVLACVTGLSQEVVRPSLDGPARALSFVAMYGAAFLLMATGLAWMRSRMLSKRLVSSAPTWDCGYVRSTERMQYTASSFAQPLTATFAVLLQTQSAVAAPTGLFPRDASLATETADIFKRNMYQPLFGGVSMGLALLRPLQHGKVQLYILYIALTLVALFIWQLA